MNAYRAFGTEAVKQAVLEDVRAGGTFYTQALSHEAVEQDITETVEQHNLHPALVRLISLLGQYGIDEEGKAFHLAAIEALPVGADQLDIIRRWYLSIWSKSEYAIAASLEGTPLLEPARKIIELVEASRTAPVERSAWRKARSALVNAIGEDVEGQENPLTSLADPMMSMAWDLEQTPGAAADVANGIGGRIFWDAHKNDPDQFTPEEGQTLQTGYAKLHEQAVASIGELTPGNAEQYQAYQSAMSALWDASPDLKALKARSDERQTRVKAVSQAWRTSAQAALLDAFTA